MPRDDVPRVVELPALYRLAQTQAVDMKARTFELVWAAGAQVRRYDFWNDEVWLEELDMSSKSVDLSRLNSGAPLLDSHQRFELANVLGVTEKAWLENGEGRALIRFSSRAEVQPYMQDVADRVIRNVSVGYDVFEFKEVGRDKESGYRIMRATNWSPFEISLVAVGADPEAQTREQQQKEGSATRRSFARCAVSLNEVAASAMRDAETTPAAIAASPKDSTMPPEGTIAAAGASADPNAAAQAAVAAQGATPSITVGPRAIDLETERRVGIENLCRMTGVEDRVRDLWITSGASMRAVTDELVQIQAERQKHNPQAETKIGLTSRETQRFSIVRAIDACANQNWTQAGFEAECSRAIAGKLQRSPQPNRFFVPWEVQERQNRTPLEDLAYAMMKRDLTVASAGAGGYLVETSNVGFIELLRNRSALYSMGAMRMGGLVGNVSIPKQSATGSATWLANEASTIAEINQTFVQVTASPKNIGGYTEISRQLMLQANPAIEGLVMSDLATVVALEIDKKGINGSGSGGEPTGILSVSGVGSVTGTSLAYDDIIEFQTDTFAGNALTLNSGYLTTGAVAGLLKQRVKFSNTASPLWDGRLESGNVDGYRGMASNQMPSATMLFGDFGTVVICEWGVLEIEVNPFANFQAGIVGVRAIAAVDIITRYASAFSAANTIT
jgi:HK97 family phage major capsid protein